MKIGTVVTLVGLLAAPLGAQQRVPGVDVWITTAPTALAQGTPVAARATTDAQAYLVVFRVTPDNHITVLIPNGPDASYQIPASGLRGTGIDASFFADSVNGVGHVYAVASYTPFDFQTVRSGNTWDFSRFNTQHTVNATALADAFVRQIVPSRETAYGMNDIAYYVGVTPPATADGMSHTETTVTYVPSQSGRVVPDDGFDDYSGAYYWGYPYASGNVWYPMDYWYSDDYWNSAYGSFYSPFYGSYGYGYGGYSYYKVCGNGAVVSIYAACSVSTVPHKLPTPRRPLPVATRPLSPIVPGTPGISPSRPVPGTPGLVGGAGVSASSAPGITPPIRPHFLGHHRSMTTPHLAPPTPVGTPSQTPPVITPPPARNTSPTPIHTVPPTHVPPHVPPPVVHVAPPVHVPPPPPPRPIRVAPPPRPAPPPPPPRHESSPPPQRMDQPRWGHR